MYIWRIEQLKDRMLANPLNDREALPYLVAFVGLTAAVSFFPGERLNTWDHLGTGFGLILAVVGTIWIYRQNGGAEGRFLLQRYLAIGWVVGIRWMVALRAVGICFFAMLAALGFVSEGTTWYDTLFIAAAELVLYWRIGSHVRNVAMRDKPV